MNTIQKEQVRRMRLVGGSYSTIAANLGISINTIKSFCRRNGLCEFAKSKPPIINQKNITCRQCRKPLKQGSKGKPKKFCSEPCRREWWKANADKLSKKAFYILTCESCGAEFESYGNKSRKYCCHSCYIKSRFKSGENHVA
jgi:hypothetical protein